MALKKKNGKKNGKAEQGEKKQRNVRSWNARTTAKLTKQLRDAETLKDQFKRSGPSAFHALAAVDGVVANLSALITEVQKFEDAWKPPSPKAKPKLGPGVAVQVKEDHIKAYTFLGDLARLNKITIVSEHDNRSYVCQLGDGTKTLMSKRHLLVRVDD